MIQHLYIVWCDYHTKSSNHLSQCYYIWKQTTLFYLSLLPMFSQNLGEFMGNVTKGLHAVWLSCLVIEESWVLQMQSRALSLETQWHHQSRTETDWTTCIPIHFRFNIKISLKFCVTLGSVTLENIQRWFQFE